MNEKSTTVIFFGTDSFSLTALRALYKFGYKIEAIVTKPDSISGRGHKLQPPVIKLFGIEHGIPVWQPDHVKDINDMINNISDNCKIGILSSYGKIIPKSTIDLFSPGIINIHPSLLPRYRGPTPIESAIFNGDQETGVSIMLLDKGMDSGPIYCQKHYSLDGSEDQLNLYERLADLGARELINVLPSIIRGDARPKKQDETKATYCHILEKNDRWLDVNKMTATEAERKIRAHIVYPRTVYKVPLDNGSIDIIITRAHVVQEHVTALDIACKDGSYLSIDELIAPSGRKMNKKSFENGYLR